MSCSCSTANFESMYRPAVIGDEGVEEQTEHTALWCTCEERDGEGSGVS